MKLLEYFIEEKKIKLHPSFPITTLAHLTEGYSAGNVEKIKKFILID